MAKGVASPALIQALSGAVPLSQAAISALMHFIARECHWRLESFDWVVVHRTYHKCFADNDGARFLALVGTDAPILALSHISEDGAWSFFDDASVASAVSGYYGHSVQLLMARDLDSDLSEQDRAWLAGLGERMRDDLRYWNPRTVGDVIFNFWD